MRMDSGFWSNDTFATLNRLDMRDVMAVRTNTTGIAVAVEAIPDDAWQKIDYTPPVKPTSPSEPIDELNFLFDMGELNHSAAVDGGSRRHGVLADPYGAMAGDPRPQQQAPQAMNATDATLSTPVRTRATRCTMPFGRDRCMVVGVTRCSALCASFSRRGPEEPDAYLTGIDVTRVRSYNRHIFIERTDATCLAVDVWGTGTPGRSCSDGMAGLNSHMWNAQLPAPLEAAAGHQRR